MHRAHLLADLAHFFDRDPRITDVAQTVPGIAFETLLDQLSNLPWRLRRQFGEIDRTAQYIRQRV